MKLETPVNANYCATVVRVKNLIPLANADNLVGMPMFGLQAVVGKDTQVGDIGILFPAEVQLSEKYLFNNSLYRHTEKNSDAGKKGYLEDNRRVRAIKLRGHRSDALFMPLESVEYSVGYVGEFREGDQFDHLNGEEICRKYERPVVGGRMGGNRQVKQADKRVEERLFPQHFDSAQFLRVADGLDWGLDAVITQKLHGTSIRVGNIPVVKPVSMWRQLLSHIPPFKAPKREYEYAMVYGSRKVIKDANNPNQQHFYDEDIWTREGKNLDGLIPQNYIVYGELVGWVGGSPIQEHYTYDCPPGTCKLYVYRVSIVNNQGTIADLGWDAVKDFCQSVGLNHVPELFRTPVGRLLEPNNSDLRGLINLDTWLDVKFHEVFVKTGNGTLASCVPLSPDSPCDEGVCIRIEGMIPQIYKAKSPMFLQLETQQLDNDAITVEDVGNNPTLEMRDVGSVGVGSGPV